MSRKGHFLADPSLESTRDLLTKSGRCFYIPAYQRSFGWREENIGRFFEDIVHGIEVMASSDPDAEGSVTETFLGTVVCFEEGVPHLSVIPRVENDLPSQIYILLDGQQRLTVCLTTAMVLHDFLVRNSKNLPKINSATEPFIELKELIQTRLYKLLADEASSGKRPYYPRMIRAMDDQWSTKPEKSKYVTPISSLLAKYIDYVRGQKSISDESQFTFSKAVKADIISKYVEEISKSKVDDTYSFEALPEIKAVFESESMQRELFSRSGSIDLFAVLRERIDLASSEEDRSKFKTELQNYESVGRVLTFTSYLMERVKYICMVTTSENYALSIFDSLNTTGDPLTAFETFVPAVSNSFSSPEEYMNSPIRAMIKEIGDYLDRDTDKQAIKTKELLVAFALAETGKKLTKDLSHQRSYMLHNYSNLLENKEKKVANRNNFIANLLYTARVNEGFVKTKNEVRAKFLDALEGRVSEEENQWGDDPSHQMLSKEAVFCLRFLSHSNHRIVIPIFARFYSEYKNSKTNASHKVLCKAIRSTAAFFALWRISRPDSDGIDNHHRKIMSHQSSLEQPPQLNFARNAKKRGIPNLARLQNEFCRLLVKDSRRAITDAVHGDDTSEVKLSKSQWIALSQNIPIYSKQKEVAKFILLLDAYWRSHKTTASSGVFDSFLWSHDAHATIEHIKARSSPDAKKVEDKNLLDSIGNLTLLPKRVNASLNDAGWKRCQRVYAAITSTKGIDIDVRLKQNDLSEKENQQLKKDYEALYEGPYIPQLKKIVQCPDFGFKQIEHRSKEILNFVWEPLIEWLGTDTYKKE